VGIPVVDGLQGSAGPHNQLGEQSRGKNTGGRRKHVEDGTRRPRQGRVAAKNGSWFFSSHGRTVLLHSAAGGHRRAEALTAGHPSPRMRGGCWTKPSSATKKIQEGGCWGAQRGASMGRRAPRAHPGFGFGGASASGTALGTGANGSVVFGFSAGTPTQWWLWHNLAYPAVLLVAKPRVLSPSASKAKH